MDTTSHAEHYEESIDAFNKISDIYYDRMGDYFRDPEFTDYPMITKFCSFVKPGGHILDVGCGPGGASDRFVKAGFQVTGIDMATDMLAVAKRDIPSAQFKYMDMRKMKFEDGTFDALAVLYSLYQLLEDTDIDMALREFWRVLKPNGILCILLKEMEAGERKISKTWYSMDNTEVLGVAYYNLINRDSLLPKVQKRGFSLLFESYWREPKLDKYSSHRFYVLQKLSRK